MISRHLRLLCWVVVLSLLLAVPAPARALAAIRYVAPGAGCGGASPCYGSIQAAVDAAQAGDEIRVAASSYSGVNNQGGKPQVVYAAKNLTLRGGYTTSNWTTPDPAANLTEINAQTLGRVLFVASGVTLNISGFHLAYGNASGLGGFGAQNAGGAVYLSNAALHMTDCQVLHSTTASGGAGGGLFAGQSSLTITNTRFEDNTSDNGGGAFLYLSTATVSGSTFYGNRVLSMNATGQALSADQGTLTFTGNTLEANIATSDSVSDGSLYISKASFTVENNLITLTNSTTRYGSGVTLSYASGSLSDNTITSNRNLGVQIAGGYVEMSGNEVAYNQGRAPGDGSGVAFSPNPLNPSRFTMTGNYIHHNTDNYGTAGGAGANVTTRVDNPAFLYYNRIQDNVSADGSVLSEDGNGGGLYISGDYATVVGNVIQRNFARGYLAANNSRYGGCGGGVYIKGSATLVNNIITDNKARFAGSGIYVEGSSPNLYHNTIANNIYSVSEDGSGVYSAESASNVPGQPRLYDNIITHQTVGVYADKADVTSLALVETVLWHANGANTGGPGTVFVNDPHTGDPLYADLAGYDYHIGSDSAAVDEASSGYAWNDIDREPRSDPADLGADEYWAPGAIRWSWLPMIRR